ncbi:uncharacterized protein LOC128931353 [Callithrix jacchus]
MAWCFALGTKRPRRRSSASQRRSRGLLVPLLPPAAALRAGVCVTAHRAAGTSLCTSAPPLLATFSWAAKKWSSASSGPEGRAASRQERGAVMGTSPLCPRPLRLRFQRSTSQPQLCFPDMLLAIGLHACEGSVCVCAGGGRARRVGALPPRTRMAVCPPAALGGKARGRRRGCAPAALITASLLPPGHIYIRATLLNFYGSLPPPVPGRTRAGSELPRRALKTPAPRLRPVPGAQTDPEG